MALHVLSEYGNQCHTDTCGEIRIYWYVIILFTSQRGLHAVSEIENEAVQEALEGRSTLHPKSERSNMYSYSP